MPALGVNCSALGHMGAVATEMLCEGTLGPGVHVPRVGLGQGGCNVVAVKKSAGRSASSEDHTLPPPAKEARIRAVSKRATAHLRADPAMGRLIDRIGPPKLRPRRLPPFQSLTHAIIHQQLSGKAAGTILERFLALFGNDGFPTPEAVLNASPERLRSAGLSRPKASYVVGIAQSAVDGHIPTLSECDRMTDAELVERLTRIKGVGRWTVEMLLIFNLGRPDVLPVHDLGVRKGFQFAYRKRKLPEPEDLARYGGRWPEGEGGFRFHAAGHTIGRQIHVGRTAHKGATGGPLARIAGIGFSSPAG